LQVYAVSCFNFHSNPSNGCIADGSVKSNIVYHFFVRIGMEVWGMRDVVHPAPYPLHFVSSNLNPDSGRNPVRFAGVLCQVLGIASRSHC